jgi:hypothetical protein
MFYMVFKWFSDVFASVSDACFKCFIYIQTYVAGVASGCFKSRSSVASRSLLALDCLALVSPSSLGAGLASELEAHAGAVPSPFSRCWQRDGGWAVASGADEHSLCYVVPFGARSVTLFYGSIAKIKGLLWQVLNWS